MSYPGGKNGSGVYQRIICMMPPHRVYIEPFLGGGAIIRLKRPAAVNIAMDLHAPAVRAFQAALFDAIGDRTRSGVVRSADPGLDDPRRRPTSAPPVADPSFVQSGLPAAAPHWTIRARDGLAFLETSPELLSGPDVLVYCDPPYVEETLSSRGRYKHMLSDADHQRLLRWALEARCNVMVSGYWSEMYGSQLQNWRCSRFQAMTRGGLAEECVWSNFPEPTELHDYRYLGEGFRERERINRKKKRWVRKLENMPMLERRCLLSAIAETAVSSDGGLQRSNQAG